MPTGWPSSRSVPLNAPVPSGCTATRARTGGSASASLAVVTRRSSTVDGTVPLEPRAQEPPGVDRVRRPVELSVGRQERPPAGRGRRLVAGPFAAVAAAPLVDVERDGDGAPRWAPGCRGSAKRRVDGAFEAPDFSSAIASGGTRATGVRTFSSPSAIGPTEGRPAVETDDGSADRPTGHGVVRPDHRPVREHGDPRRDARDLEDGLRTASRADLDQVPAGRQPGRERRSIPPLSTILSRADEAQDPGQAAVRDGRLGPLGEAGLVEKESELADGRVPGRIPVDAHRDGLRGFHGHAIDVGEDDVEPDHRSLDRARLEDVPADPDADRLGAAPGRTSRTGRERRARA